MRTPGHSATPAAARAAFSLTELIVVVVIIGVLAAIAVPRFSQGVSQAGPAASMQDLAILQQQIELYALEHGGVYPAYNSDGTNAAHSEGAFLSQLTQYSDSQGQVSPTPSNLFRFGPYLRHDMPPVKYGPKSGLSGVLVVTGNTALLYQAGQDVGWLYNDTTGEIVANEPDALGAGKTFEASASATAESLPGP